MTMKRTLPWAIAVVAVAMIAVGIARGEVLDVISNARILCFSCIGLK